MPDLLLLLPDFALIALGYLICRHTPLDRTVWDGAERLVYFLLFPCLLFQSILKNPIRIAGPSSFRVERDTHNEDLLVLRNGKR